MARVAASGRVAVSGRVALPAWVNYVAWSNDLSKLGSSQASADMASLIAGPLAGSQAGRMFDNATSSGHVLFDAGVAVGAGVATHSIFAKAGTKHWISMQPGSASPKAFFDLTAGTVGYVTGGASGKITPYGNGWFRCATTFAESSSIFRVYTADGDGPSGHTYLGTGAGSVYLWGLQVVYADWPGPFLATAGAPVPGALRNLRAARVSV